MDRNKIQKTDILDKNKRYNRTNKKVDNGTDNGKIAQPDSGDAVKNINKFDEPLTAKKKIDQNSKELPNSDRGDNDRKTYKITKHKAIVTEKNTINNSFLKESLIRRVDKDLAVNKKEDRIEKHAKDKPLSAKNKKEESTKACATIKASFEVNIKDRVNKKPSDNCKEKENLTHSTNDDHKDRSQRRPIIKTITSKGEKIKVYKAVTFVEQKKKPTLLQVKIPSDYKRMSDTNAALGRLTEVTVSRTSVKEKAAPRKHPERRKHQKRRLVSSPDLTRRVLSPPTEVAKWAPSSINKHTKPYYEAWVSTTLAAISKNHKKDKLYYEKQNILEKFQKSLDNRPDTPDLIYENFYDERYTGRIKVKQR